MTIKISIPDVGNNLHPQITVLGVGGSGGNAVNNMINSNLEGVDFAIANTDAQALQISNCKKKIQLGINSTRGLGAGMRPDIGKNAAEETLDEIAEMLEGSHMLFIAAGMGGGTGTGAAPVIAKLAREKGILTVGVVTKPFHFEGSQRMKLADKGLEELQQYVDTLLTIPNQNLFRIANEKTTFADAFKMADDVLYAGVRGVTDLMVQPGLINLDFSDVKTVMSEMGKAMMGTGEASGEGRAIAAAEAAIANPLIDDVSLKGAKGLIINITGGNDITLYEVDEAANRIKQEVDEEANIIYGTTCDERLEGVVRVSIVATGIDASSVISAKPLESIQSLSIDNSVYIEKSVDAHKTQPLIHRGLVEETAIHVEPEIQENLNQESMKSNFIELDNHPENSIEDTLTSEILDSSSENISEFDEVISENALNLTDNDSEIDESNSEDTPYISHDADPVLQGEQDSINNKTDHHEKLNLEGSFEKDVEPSVRRLSLFDTLEDSEKDTTQYSNKKTEPIFDNKSSESIDSEVVIEESIVEPEFSVEEGDINQDYNQEAEEELLDIPTFLRRQAN